MSFSAVNMSRFVIAFIVISFVSNVLAGTVADPGKNKTDCGLKPEIIAIRKGVMNCFKNIVALHLNSSAPKIGDCQNAADFGKKLNKYFHSVETICDLKLTYNTSDIIKLVEFSLRKDSFKKFNEDVSCMKSFEFNISNTCVKGNTGFFNITNEKKQTSWYRKSTLRHNILSCTASKKVKECVENTLKTCGNSTREYVASLFKYARELANCTQIESNVPAIPPPGGSSGAVQLAASWLSIPVTTIVTILISKNK